RIHPATALTRANIPCLVWGKDALAFVYSRPALLSDWELQLVVPDDKLEGAALTITSAMPFKRMSTPPERWLEPDTIDPSRPSCFPHSVYLKSTIPDDVREDDYPGEIDLHPESALSFDISDHTRSTTLTYLPHEYAALRFPTRTAFLDALLDVSMDPPSGVRVWELAWRLNELISHIITYTLRAKPVLPNGELEPEHASVLNSLRPENRPIFQAYLRSDL
ncbi:hypothetical protein FB451DRAFT_1004537, partial [Mycena latifolia]